MAQHELYYDVQLETQISLHPKQLNSKIEDNILSNLKDKVEKKVGEHGIVIKVNNIISYDYGIITAMDFSGSVIYTVKYSCLLARLTKNMEFNVQIINTGKGLYVGFNGPILIVIYSYNINIDKFKEENYKIFNKEDKELQKDDYVKVSVMTYNNFLGQGRIVAICRLLDYSSKKEISTFKKQQNIGSGIEDDKSEEKDEYI